MKDGPSPAMTVVILLLCIIILGVIFALIKVFLVPAPHQCIAGVVPDPVCTPGRGTDVPLDVLCKPGYTKTVRNVLQEEKDQVYAEYNLPNHAPGEYEVDHLISLELGGTNDIENLWPEKYDMQNGAHEKDKIENYLHKLVCAGRMNLSDAQHIIATNWTMMLNET